MAPVPLRARVRRLVESDPTSPASRWVDRVVLTLIVLNVLAVMLESIPEYDARYREALRAFELASVAVFAVEYLLRLWAVVEDPRFAHPVLGRLRWMATPLALVDLLAILPAFFLGQDLRVARVLRLLRLLKLGRYWESLRVLGHVFRTRRNDLLSSFLVVMVVLVVASSLMYYAEREAQPERFSSIPASMWWGVVTLTTVGYGDVVPVTAAGKLVGSLTALAGVLALALPVGILASGFTTELESRRRKPEPCPHCGKDLPHRP